MTIQALEKAIDGLDLAVEQLKNAASATAQEMVQVSDAASSSPFMLQFAVFVLAIFVGYYVVWSVTPALHTPLMAVTNAISSVIVVGALLAVGLSAFSFASVVGFIALILASINIFGGFLVTGRMLAMYKKKDR